MTCHLYIIAHDVDGKTSSPVKVGITKNLNARLASIQTGSWRKVCVAYQFTVESRDIARHIEARFHSDHSAHRLCGEWFDIEPIIALETLCGLVFDTLESLYSEEDRTVALCESGAIDHLKTVNDEFWGLPIQDIRGVYLS